MFATLGGILNEQKTFPSLEEDSYYNEGYYYLRISFLIGLAIFPSKLGSLKIVSSVCLSNSSLPATALIATTTENSVNALVSPAPRSVS